MNKKIIEFLKNENIEIPDNDDAIVNLYFGSMVIKKINYWINWCNDFVDNSEPAQPYVRMNEAAKKDKDYRSSLSKLDDTAKEQLKKLIKETIEGIMFSFLLDLDQPSVGEWKLTLEKEDGKKIGIVNKGDDLHENLYYWMNIFNKKIEEETNNNK
jgi:hypothetical protein